METKIEFKNKHKTFSECQTIANEIKEEILSLFDIINELEMPIRKEILKETTNILRNDFKDKVLQEGILYLADATKKKQIPTLYLKIKKNLITL